MNVPGHRWQKHGVSGDGFSASAFLTGVLLGNSLPAKLNPRSVIEYYLFVEGGCKNPDLIS
jgi:hypothetical protein